MPSRKAANINFLFSLCFEFGENVQRRMLLRKEEGSGWKCVYVTQLCWTYFTS